MQLAPGLVTPLADALTLSVMIVAAVSVQMKNGVFIVEGGFEYALESLPHSLSMPREHDYQRPVGPRAGHPGTHSQAEV